jgi:hypothetical protein
VLLAFASAAQTSKHPDDTSGLDVVATNIAGVSAFRALSKDFDANNASDAELARHGLPPRPDKDKSPTAYGNWLQIVAAAAYRVVPTLETTNVYHGAVQGWKLTGKRVGGLVDVQSSNWSGFVIEDTNNSFRQGALLSGTYVVPQLMDCKSGGPIPRLWSSNWIGFDGQDSPDVFQVGTSSDNRCDETFGGGPRANFYAWYEWYPQAETRMTSEGVIPGDYITLYLYVRTNPTSYAFTYINESRRRSVSMPLSPPPGTTFVGNTVEWIVERPTINGSLPKLAPYLWSNWYGGYEQDMHNNPQMPSSTLVGTVYSVTMVDQNTQGVMSVPTLIPHQPHVDTFWFQYIGQD